MVLTLTETYKRTETIFNEICGKHIHIFDLVPDFKTFHSEQGHSAKCLCPFKPHGSLHESRVHDDVRTFGDTACCRLSAEINSFGLYFLQNMGKHI